MKKLFFFFILCLVSACTNSADKISANEMQTDNPELTALHEADQNDRKSGNIDWSVVGKRDQEREKRVFELLDSNKVHTAKDYYNAAMIFQHGGDTIASSMAVKMMRQAVKLDTGINKWLLAAAIDRDLMRRGEPQIYGTQYTREGATTKWKLYTLDTTKVTDQERRAYNVRTLAEQQERVIQMNKIRLYELYTARKSIEDIIEICKTSTPEESEYAISQGGLNEFGYTLMAENKDEEALKIFQLNTELHPKGFNTWDSLGECLLKLDRKEEGISAYKKSLELNPKNDNAKKVLEELEQNS